MRHLPPALHHRDYRLLWLSILASGFAANMVAVAVGWQVYSINGSAFDLGLIGLAEFLPLVLLALPAGQLADRLPRRGVVAASLAAQMAVAGLLAVITLRGAHALWAFLLMAFLTGASTAFGNPAGRALLPELVPVDLFEEAIALRSIAYQVSTIGGPAIGGLLFALHEVSVYLVSVGLLAVAAVCALLLTPRAAAGLGEPPGLQSLLGGIRFIRRTRVLLGAITLDLFAVLFGGAIALLPLYAKSILHTGPLGLGVLRSMPAVGALAGAVLLTRRPLGGRAGEKLLLVVALFGVSTIVFGLSRSLWLSALALAFGGFVDMFSMNIRSTIVGLATPNALRGRVNSVEGVFIRASNELGAFESGAAAALLGATTAVVAGGVVTIVLALVWPKVFPEVARIDRLDEVTAPATREALAVD
jgi:MFS family permease